MKHFEVIAPTRVDLAGGTLDLWPLFTLFPQCKTINAAIDLNAHVKFHWSPDAENGVSVHSPTGEVYHSFDEAHAPASIKFPLYLLNRFIGQHGSWKGHLSLNIKTTAPLRSGLGGSSTLCVALVKGLQQIYALPEESYWRFMQLHWCKDAEAGFLKTPTGTQDYLAALFGSLRCYTYSPGSLSENGYSQSAVLGFKEHMLVLFSGEMHHSGLSNWEIYKNAIEGKEGMVEGLNQIRLIADEVDTELKSETPSWSVVGKLLSREWETRRNVFKVQTPRLDEIVTFLKKQKILGVKVCGAASGGSLLALVEPAHRDTVKSSAEKAGIQVLATTLQEDGVKIV